MNAEKVNKYLIDTLQAKKSEGIYPRAIFNNLVVKVYSGSFGWLTIQITSEYAFASGYVANYNAIDEKINDFLHRALFNLYERYYTSHHQKRRG
jgi:hypothetical protein